VRTLRNGCLLLANLRGGRQPPADRGGGAPAPKLYACIAASALCFLGWGFEMASSRQKGAGACSKHQRPGAPASGRGKLAISPWNIDCLAEYEPCVLVIGLVLEKL